MAGEIEDVDESIATGVGLYALSDATLHDAAKAAGVTSWELEEAIVEAGLGEAFGIDGEADVTAEIDRLLDEQL
ncbi:hypothetical protein BRC87_02480 [Halobacteriales archaeon QS_4_66_20]|jgi:hypothetical protein|nr:MAG: hypothetical protein BRC87_02480 [Halobacteriales archaeon QS_4_66_20]